MLEEGPHIGMSHTRSLGKGLLELRVKAQEDAAKAMHTNTSAVGRLEMSGGKRHHSPSLATLRRYAHAVGCDVRIKFFPKKKSTQLILFFLIIHASRSGGTLRELF